MQIQTFSIVVGSPACDAACPFCISHQTGYDLVKKEPATVKQLDRFRKAARLAQMCNATTVLFTGKGEPTLYPESITEYLVHLQTFQFPFLELQTNAIQMGYLAEDRKPKGRLQEHHLELWSTYGLNTIAISVVDVNSENNRQVYAKDYPNLANTINYLHTVGYSIRLCVMMQQGMVDSYGRVEDVLAFCREHKVEQCTIRPIRRAEKKEDSAAVYVDKYGLSDAQVKAISDGVANNGTHILTIMNGAHAAKIYDVDGQNLCVSDCLTVDPDMGNIRTLIFYPETGRIAYDWQYQGAVLL